MPWEWEGYGVVDHCVRERRWSGSKISDYAREIAESGVRRMMIGLGNFQWRRTLQVGLYIIVSSFEPR